MWPASNEPWKIESLALHPEWLSDVVAWHHAEWLRNFDDESHEESHVSSALAEREQSMRHHLCDDTIPSTFIALQNKRPVGSVSLIDYPLSRDPARVWLTNLYVDTPYQKQGIGAALLEYAEGYAFRNGIQEISLYTFDASDYYLQRAWVWLSKGELHGQELDVFSKQKSP